jgi:hypothetical protein
MFPVEVCYLKEPVSDYCEAAVETVFNIHMKEPNGDILVFLTGREEIDNVLQQVADRAQRYAHPLNYSRPHANFQFTSGSTKNPTSTAIRFITARRTGTDIRFSTTRYSKNHLRDQHRRGQCNDRWYQIRRRLWFCQGTPIVLVRLMIDQNFQSTYSNGCLISDSMLAGIRKSKSWSCRSYILWKMFPALPFHPSTHPKYMYAYANHYSSRTHTLGRINVSTPIESPGDRQPCEIRFHVATT